MTSNNEVVTLNCADGDLFKVVEKGREATEAMPFEQAKTYARERNPYVDVEDDGRVYEMLEEEAQARLKEEYERLDACSQANNPLLEILDKSADSVHVIAGVETIDQEARQLLSTPEIPWRRRRGWFRSHACDRRLTGGHGVGTGLNVRALTAKSTKHEQRECNCSGSVLKEARCN
ncbi:hypothetical protein K1W69_17090 [Hoeflea sp. WL0058]|uniref:Uncharacterized protein n=1 Tax=Flavimaribacter sediminis TaxID=2865987 RepID=A0AAE3D0V2_9HYPH|nr:hypothetical protein [Flavimaribacter sediminis]MBW8638915.1 hypothetical protein [Flavimaribacter sediminis]